MKLGPREAPAFLSRPDPRTPALLIYGADAMRVADKRAQVVKAHTGPHAETEMRVTRLSGADLRRDAAALSDAVRAMGFFPGPRAVIVDEATDALAEAMAEVLRDWTEGCALIVATGGELKPTSKLRKLFEGDRRALVLAVYDDPPSRDEIERSLRDAGLGTLPADTLRDLVALAQAIEPGDFRQTLERIALYKLGDPTPLSPAEVALLAPPVHESEVDDAINAIAEGRLRDLPAILTRLKAQGATPVTVCIRLSQHFRLLHALLSDPRGPAQALASARPPVFGPRRDRILEQTRRWTLARTEDALRDLTATDMVLRSSSPAPLQALAERAMLRMARLAERR